MRETKKNQIFLFVRRIWRKLPLCYTYTWEVSFWDKQSRRRRGTYEVFYVIFFNRKVDVFKLNAPQGW